MTQMDVAARVGATPRSFQRWEKGHVPGDRYLIKLARLFRVDVDWLKTGEGDPGNGYHAGGVVLDDVAEHDAAYAGSGTECRVQREDAPRQAVSGNVILSEHADVIRQFRDKAYARDLNMDLVELERLDPEAYREVGSYIKGVLEGLRMATKRSGRGIPDRRQGERRQNAGGPPPGTPERRGGRDRRRA